MDFVNWKVVVGGVLVVLVLCAISGTFGIVGAGERGVTTTFGAVSSDVKGEGLYIKIPFVQEVIIADVRVQKKQTEASAASKDLQIVHSVVALNFNIKPEAVATIYQQFGVDFKDRMIDPALQESVKSVTARYTAEELVTKREEVREAIKVLLREKLAPMGIVVDELNIVNFDFSPSFNAAVEAKVTAEQNALAAENKLAQVRFEADQAIAEAKGKAEAIRLTAQALAQSPQVLQLRWIERWNGAMPTTVLGNNTTAMIQVP